MFIENQKQQNTENPMQIIVAEENRINEVDLGLSLCGLITFLTATIIGWDLRDIEYILSAFFTLDFFYQLVIAKNKKKYLSKNWINLVLSVPFFPTAWMVVTLTIRMLKVILEYTLVKIHSAFNAMLLIGASLVLFATVSILQFETLEACNIKTVWDAMWWSICTITTVGYGDKFPITGGGKIVAIILMICGIGLFGTLIGYISTFFIDKEKKNNNTIDTIEELSHQINELRNELKNNK